MSTHPPPAGHVASHPADPADSTIHDARQRRTVLIAVCIALMAVIASVTGLNVAQPELAVEFDASQSEVLWFINLYTISLAALLLRVVTRVRGLVGTQLLVKRGSSRRERCGGGIAGGAGSYSAA